MAQQVRRRKQGTVEYSANNKQTIDLSRGVVYRELAIRLTGRPTLTNTSNTTAKTLRGDEWAVCKKIEIIANGTDVIKSLSGDALWWFNYFYYNRPRVTPAIGDGSTANPTFDSVLVLPFWSPGTVKPIDTALDARELSSLKVEVTWGDYTSINADATAWTTEPRLQVYSLESFNITGPFSQFRIFPIEKEITASNTEFEIELPVGKMYRGFLMEFTDADVDANDILNNFKMVSGSTVFSDVSAGDDILQQWEDIRRGTVPGFDSTYHAVRRSAQSKRDGLYVYDHVTDGFMTEAVDTLGFSEFKLVLDVTKGSGTTKARVWPLQIIPVRGGGR